MRRFAFPLLFLASLLLWIPTVEAQPAERTSSLSVDQIMQEPKTWVGDWPENVRWHENGQTLYFDWNPDGQFESDSLYKVPRSGGAPTKVSPEERRSHPPFFDGWHHGEQVYTDDDRRKVYTADGDLYLYNRQTDSQTRLTDTRADEASPRFGPNGETVNAIENFWRHLKCSIEGTHTSVSRQHLERYVKEFEFRFNRRMRPETMLFELLTRFPSLDA